MAIKDYSDNTTIITSLDFTSDELTGVEQDDVMKVITEANRAIAYATQTKDQTLVMDNKTFTLPQINDTSEDHQYIFAVSELTADRTVTLPLLTGADEFVFKDFIQTLTNKTLTSPVLTTPQINDTSADHQYIVAVSELTSDRTVTLPLLLGNDEFVFKDFIQTLTNKTLTSPVLTTPQINDTSEDHQYVVAVSELTDDRTVTLPLLVGNDEFVFKDHIQTLTNKTLTSPKINEDVVLTPTSTELNYVNGVTSAIQDQIDIKAPLASPSLTGTPVAPTAAVDTDTTQLATTAFVNAQIASDVGAVVLSYGVSWDENADTYSRTGSTAAEAASQSLADALIPIQAAMRRCVINDAGVVQYYLDPADSTKRVGGGVADLTGTDGQVMVEIPAFYYRYAYSGTTHTWAISPTPASGFSLHPAFIKNNEFVPYRYMGAYEGSLYDISASRYTNGLELPAVSMTFANATSIITCASLSHPFSKLEAGDKFVIAGTSSNNGTFTVSSKTDQTITTVEALADETAGSTTLDTQKDWNNDILSSVFGKAPINDGSRPNFRTAAASRGTGWRLQDYDIVCAVQLLYIIEYADFYSKSMIGAGLSNFAGWAAWNNLNPIETTGNSNGDGNATASLDNGNNTYGSYMSYRGVENFYGHSIKWVDGININEFVPYVSNNDTDFADGTASNYTNLLVAISDTDGYQQTLEQTDRGFLCATVGASSSTFITDYFDGRSGWRGAQLGGDSNDTTRVGVFDWVLGATTSDPNRRYFGRLAF